MVGIEYLESTGTQYVDTGYYADGYTSVDIVMRLSPNTNLSNFEIVYIGRESSSVPVFWGQFNSAGIPQGSTLYFYCRQNTMRYTYWKPLSTAAATAWGNYHLSARSVTANGVSLTPNNVVGEQGRKRCATQLRIFERAQGGSVQIASVKIHDNGVLVRDFVPVRIETAGYLYDKVTGNLFGNSGTGSFILGPDKIF